MNASPPFVSVVVPCRNEKSFIVGCLDSLLSSDYPQDRLEILVVDGRSDDGTRADLETFARRHSRLRLLDNPRRITPSALNIGINAARGSVIVRIDAHNSYPSDYVRRLVDRLLSSGVDNVGGVLVTLPANDTPTAKAIAFALAHTLGVGNAHFRIGTSQPRLVDTVPFGCYRREVFDRIGLFDEELVRNQDDEFNHRLVRSGGRILLDPTVVSYYHARDSYRKLWRMYYQYGLFKPLAAYKAGGIATFRQLVPSLFLVSLVASAAAAAFPVARVLFAAAVTAYVGAVSLTAISAIRQIGARGAAALYGAFAAIHVSYGAGFIHGAVNLLFRRRKRGVSAEAVPISR